MHKKPYIYMDHNATTTTLRPVRQGVEEVMRKGPTNPSAIHASGREGKNYVENARTKINDVLHADRKEYQVIFTASGTEANNLALQHQNNRFVITSNIEHPSVLNVVGSQQAILHPNTDGVVEVETLEKTIKLLDTGSTSNLTISVMLANNEIGTIQPIRDLVKAAKNLNQNIIFHTDASQAVGKIDVSIEELGVDMMTISAHKFGGPPGVGALITRKKIVDNVLRPIIYGGGQEYRMRSGTLNVPAIHGFGIACDHIKQTIIGFDGCKKLVERLRSEIKNICPTSIIFGDNTKQKLPNTISLSMPGVKAETQVIHFDINGIGVSAGSACSSGKVDVPYVQMALGYTMDQASSAIRVSLGAQNSIGDIEYFVKIWEKLYSKNK